MRDMLIARKVSVSQLTELRMHVEPEVARLAALRRTDKDLQEMERSASRSHQDPTGEDYVKHNANFHRIVGRASQNLLYSVVQDCIMDITEEFIGTIKSVREVLHDPDDHAEIYQAILEREGDRGRGHHPGAHHKNRAPNAAIGEALSGDDSGKNGGGPVGRTCPRLLGMQSPRGREYPAWPAGPNPRTFH